MLATLLNCPIQRDRPCKRDAPKYQYLALCVYQLWKLEGGWVWNYVCVTVELLSSLYTKLNSWVCININCKFKKDVSNDGLFGFLYFLLFSGRSYHAHKQYHISLNCLALSSEAPREESEWKKCTTAHRRKIGLHARALLLLFVEGPQAVRCWGFKNRIFWLRSFLPRQVQVF